LIVDQITLTEDAGDRATRRARLRARALADDAQLVFSGPAALAAPAPDATALLAALLPLAMRMKEGELAIDGEVCPRVRAGADELQALYSRWSPAMRPVEIRAAAYSAPARQGDDVACFFSRGVDSTYSAAVPRDIPVTHLVLVDGLELHLDEPVRREEVRRARLVADLLDLPLVEAYSNIRTLSEPWMDWEDACGAGLAGCAHHLAGGLGRAVVASATSYDGLAPSGTHPLVEPLYSGRRMTIVHDSSALARVEKLDWLAANHPALLGELKVCFAENRADNCGRCVKCVVTMAALRAVRVRERPSQFPDELRVEDVEAVRLNVVGLTARISLVHTARRLDPADPVDGPLREAILRVLADPGPPLHLEPDEGPAISMRTYHSRTLVAHLRDGAPYPSLPGERAPRAALSGWDGQLGVVRAVDRVGGRHLYGVGARPPGALVGELGALRAAPPPGGRAVWLTGDGLVAVEGCASAVAAPGVYRQARWVVAPLAWRGLAASLGERLSLVAWRARRLIGPAIRGASRADGDPVGWLHARPAAGLVALYEARHPVTGDQLLTHSEHEAGDLGYGPARLVGYLDLVAPVTGRLALARVDIPWGSRWGRHARIDPPPRDALR
jgi:hypothetical protein